MVHLIDSKLPTTALKVGHKQKRRRPHNHSSLLEHLMMSFCTEKPSKTDGLRQIGYRFRQRISIRFIVASVCKIFLDIKKEHVKYAATTSGVS